MENQSSISYFLNTTVVPLGNNSAWSNFSCKQSSGSEHPCAAFLFATHVVVMGAVSIGGIVGNIMTIATLYYDSKHNLTSFLLVVLAVFDNGVLVLTILVKCVPGICSYIGGAGVCWYRMFVWPYIMKYIFPLIPTCHFASVWTIVLVTAHRTLAVLAPHKVKKYTSMRSLRFQVLMLAFTALLFNMPRFFELLVKVQKATPCSKGKTTLMLDIAKFYYNRFYQIAYKNIATKIFLDFGPLILLSVMTYRLIKEIQIAMAKRRAITRGRSEDAQRTSTQLTILLVLVVLVFMFCQIPHTVYSVMRLFLSKRSQRCGTAFYYFMNISDTLMIVNSSVNFLLYCVAGRRFRQQLAKLFHCENKKRGRYNTGTYAHTPLTVYTQQ